LEALNRGPLPASTAVGPVVRRGLKPVASERPLRQATPGLLRPAKWSPQALRALADSAAPQPIWRAARIWYAGVRASAAIGGDGRRRSTDGRASAEFAALIAALPDRVLMWPGNLRFAGSAMFLVGLLRQIVAHRWSIAARSDYAEEQAILETLWQTVAGTTC